MTEKEFSYVVTLAAALTSADTDMIIIAWGRHGGLHSRADDIIGLISDYCDPQALYKTKADQPGHPLYLPYETELFYWSERFDARD